MEFRLVSAVDSFFFLISKNYLLDVSFTESVIAQTYCAGQSVVDFVTSSPIGMTHSVIANPSSGKHFTVV